MSGRVDVWEGGWAGEWEGGWAGWSHNIKYQRPAPTSLQLLMQSRVDEGTQQLLCEPTARTLVRQGGRIVSQLHAVCSAGVLLAEVKCSGWQGVDCQSNHVRANKHVDW